MASSPSFSDETNVAEPISPPPDEFKTLRELLRRMALILDVHLVEVQENSHRLVDILASAALARIALPINGAILECSKILSGRPQIPCRLLQKRWREGTMSPLRGSNTFISNHPTRGPLIASAANERERERERLPRHQPLNLFGEKLYSTRGGYSFVLQTSKLCWGATISP